MDQGAELDALISRMIDDYVSRNRAAKVLRDSLDEAGVGFYPVADHLTLRTLNIDRRAEEFTRLGYGYSETIEYEDWYAKVYRKIGYPALFVDTGQIVGARGGQLRQIFTVPEMIDGQPFSVLELTERHRGYQGFSPPQADSLMKSTVKRT